MDVNHNVTVWSGGASVAQMCKRLAEKEYNSADFSIIPLAKFQTALPTSSDSGGIMIGVVCHGTVKTTINNQRLELRRNNLILVREDSVVEAFKCSKACLGYVLTFSRRFLEGIDVSVRDFISASVMFRISPCMAMSAYDAQRLHNIAVALLDAVDGSGYIYDEKILSSLFSAYFYTLASILSLSQREEGDSQIKSRGDELIRRFMLLLDRHCHEQRSVEYYAAKMGITPKYLSLICKAQTGQSASKVIEQAVILKAKELLAQSGVSVQQVAERLNFVSQSFFGKYFKQRVGMSPSRYKSQLF